MEGWTAGSFLDTDGMTGLPGSRELVWKPGLDGDSSYGALTRDNR